MKTILVKINAQKPQGLKIRKAAAIIRHGGTVAFPTETVYGLGANALDAKAVRGIFRAKGRPFDDPLIVHISREHQIYELVKSVDAKAKALMEKFWPGPLTLVLEKSANVPSVTTAGLNSVAVRMPRSRIALALISESGCPIAAPSANLFGKPSPTSAQHVKEDLFGRIGAIIDGGRAHIGVESTVLDLTGKIPMLLRPGKVSLEELEAIIGKVKVHPLVKSIAKKSHSKALARAPGMKYRHYAPRAEVIVIEGANSWKTIRKMLSESRGKKIGVITTRKKNDYGKMGAAVKYLKGDYASIAKNLFRTFREFDMLPSVQIILVEGISGGAKGLGLAVENRLKKAASKVINAR
ncbi:MAG TPA: L-threonylcarbamoyladenylate synthase [archaeon]|nr:L-threonylcarbamoyladenylate synthase [archaeon]